MSNDLNERYDNWLRLFLQRPIQLNEAHADDHMAVQQKQMPRNECCATTMQLGALLVRRCKEST